jgi:CMP-N,N'-diacetyllegionaminic acid synthase
MRILAVIPARGGSKRCPGKNIRLLGGKPLIAWTIEAAREIPGLDVVVSTDSEEIARIARQCGIEIPWLRPAELATDTASVVDVCLHALEIYTDADAVMLLQPTSPFRTRQTILKGMEAFNGLPVIGVSKADAKLSWAFEKIKQHLIPLYPERLKNRSQDLPEVYLPNGSFYLVSARNLKLTKSFFGSINVPLETRYPENIDIDTEADFELAERELRAGSEGGRGEAGRVPREGFGVNRRVDGVR